MKFVWRIESAQQNSVSIHTFKGDLNINATLANRGRYHVKVIATDECGRELAIWVTIEINRGPKAIAANFPLQKAYKWQNYLFQIPSEWFSDDDTIKISVLFLGDTGSWLRFYDGASKTFIGEPVLDNVSYSVNVTATDLFGLSVSSILEIYVDTNYPPIDLNPNLILNYTFRAGE